MATQGRRITISAGSVSAEAALNHTETADRVWQSLPLTGSASTWGDEVYFATGLRCPLESPRVQVEVGDLAYWPSGTAFCIFFGPTPASRNTEPRAASPVTVFGRLEGDAGVFREVRDGDPIRVERAD